MPVRGVAGVRSFVRRQWAGHADTVRDADFRELQIDSMLDWHWSFTDFPDVGAPREPTGRMLVGRSAGYGTHRTRSSRYV